jgi:hypothetical protein
MSVHVTEHAIDRYCERVENLSRPAVRKLIHRSDRMIAAASAFGAHTVRLGNGARLVITGRRQVRVVTVLGRGMINAADFPRAPASGDDHLAAAPVCCGSCGMRAGHPLARACVRTDCPLGHRVDRGEAS